MYSKGTERIHLEQDRSRAQARGLQLMSWLLALLLPLVVGIILAAIFNQPLTFFLK